jgi:hypothetical protein
MNEDVTETALVRREEWERCAGNAYQQPDEQVLAMIAEIRRLRKDIADTNEDRKHEAFEREICESD